MKRIAGIGLLFVLSVGAIGCIPPSDAAGTSPVGDVITFVGEFLRSALAAWLF